MRSNFWYIYRVYTTNQNMWEGGLLTGRGIWKNGFDIPITEIRNKIQGDISDDLQRFIL